MEIINPRNLYIIGVVFILQYFAADYIKADLSAATMKLSTVCALLGVLLIVFAIPMAANRSDKDNG